MRLIPATGVEGDRDPGPARTGGDLQLIGYLPRDPQAVTGQIGQPTGQGRVSGRGRIAVVNLAVQCPGSTPDPQPSCAAAMADRVGRQLVNGQDHIGGLIARHARPAGMNVHACAQHGQHAGVERQVKCWRRVQAIFTGHEHRLPGPRRASPSPDVYEHRLPVARAGKPPAYNRADRPARRRISSTLPP